MDFVIDFEGRVGLRQRGKWWRVVDNHHCFIAAQAIERAFATIREWVRGAGISFFDRKRHTGLLRFALVRCNSQGEVLVNLITSVPTPEELPPLTEGLEQLSESPDINTLVWSTNHTIADVSFGEVKHVFKGEGYLEEVVRGLRYRVSPHAFFQPNLFTAPLLLEQLQAWTAESAPKVLLDLFCGTGFFALGVEKSCHHIVGVELSPEAVVDAKQNAALNESTAQFFHAPSERFDWGVYGAEAVIVDPPRGGMQPQVVESLLTNAPRSIFYVSCNYKHFANDAARLTEKYSIRAQVLLDQFPHTPHVELLCWFERK
jgi:23S rRNA (uracil-5-)-methyltransferase RumA